MFTWQQKPDHFKKYRFENSIPLEKCKFFQRIFCNSEMKNNVNANIENLHGREEKQVRLLYLLKTTFIQYFKINEKQITDKHKQALIKICLKFFCNACVINLNSVQDNQSS